MTQKRMTLKHALKSALYTLRMAMDTGNRALAAEMRGFVRQNFRYRHNGTEYIGQRRA